MRDNFGAEKIVVGVLQAQPRTPGKERVGCTSRREFELRGMLLELKKKGCRLRRLQFSSILQSRPDEPTKKVHSDGLRLSDDLTRLSCTITRTGRK